MRSLIGGPGHHRNLADVLWTSSAMFAPIDRKIGTRRVFIFTNEDDPIGGDRSEEEKAHQRAQDLGDLGIVIELFAVDVAGGATFDVSKFYQEIITYSDDVDEEVWNCLCA